MKTKEDLKLINDAVAREGKVDEKGCVVVPDDFFDRLNAKLNPPREGPSLIDRIIAAASK